MLRSSGIRYSARKVNAEKQLIESYFFNDLPGELVIEHAGRGGVADTEPTLSGDGVKISYGIDLS